MQMYWSIFWRTFAQLALAVMLSVQGLEWVNPDAITLNATTAGLGLLGAAIGGLVAALWAFGLSAAATPLEKAVRSAVQALAGGLGAIVLNETQDFFDLPVVLLGTGVAMVFAFLVTFFQNQVPGPVAPVPPDK
jgi:hypothetical protein